MNVTELIRRLKMTKEEFFPLVRGLGFDIGSRAIKVNDQVAQKIVTAINRQRKAAKKQSLFGPEKVEAKVIDEDAKIIDIPDNLTVKSFSEKLERPVTDVIAVLMKNGIMATINENLDFDTATIIAEDLGYRTQRGGKTEKVETDAEKLLATLLNDEDSSKKKDRAPVVVVMGHVDHGKTKLLDTIRKTQVMDSEAGGITQHIGAYQAEHNGRKITFIDTPGHEGFSAMRSRGARVADLAILVIAADDGIKPQTEEVIALMEKAKLPFIVAINKIDKPDADIERVKKQLSDLNLIPEDWGGKTIIAPVSAKQAKGIDNLLEMLLLVADIEKEQIQADPKRLAVGTIIESHVDKGKGPVATVLVQSGTLRIGDVVLVGNVVGKIKALTDWNAKALREAPPSTPAQILGLKGVPVVGDILQVSDDKKAMKKRLKDYHRFSHSATVSETETSSKKELRVLLRADTLGSSEAIAESLEKIQHAEVSVKVMNQRLGNITEKDIVQAEAAGAVIYGFHVGLTPGAEQTSHTSQVEIKRYSIIYELLDDAKERLEKLLDQ